MKKLLLALLVLILLPILWFGGKIALYQQEDNEEKLASKQAYLQSVKQLDRSGLLRPNIVLVLLDDLGYGDLGVTGATAIKTPAIDALANNGVMLTNYYAPAPVCTPSRAGLLTGRLPLRAGMPQVVHPSDSKINWPHKAMGINLRLPTEEVTLADVLGAAGYETGMVGKWHLGDQKPSQPNDFGFTEYFGALYSNDMTPFPLYRNRAIEIPDPTDQTQLNDLYSVEAVKFIEKNRDQPFFLYYAHNFPHIPLFSSAEQEGKSTGGLYGDVVEDIDKGIARIVATLKEQDVYDNTIILLTSDNGPWFQGSPGSNRGRKADTFEGGMHVPMIVHWPEVIAGGRKLDGLSMGIDWFPTILDWLDLPLPKDRLIDGKSIKSMLAGGADSPNDYLYYFSGETLKAVRDSRFKYHDQRKIYYTPGGFAMGVPKGPWLFDMAVDYNESYDTSMTHTEEFSKLQEVFAAKQQEMETNMRGWIH
ncbi:MAG: sulfatase family protein [Pseudomonadales bacterium]